jgi:hypothetical protein
MMKSGGDGANLKFDFDGTVSNFVLRQSSRLVSRADPAGTAGSRDRAIRLCGERASLGIVRGCGLGDVLPGFVLGRTRRRGSGDMRAVGRTADPPTNYLRTDEVLHPSRFDGNGENGTLRAYLPKIWAGHRPLPGVRSHSDR